MNVNKQKFVSVNIWGVLAAFSEIGNKCVTIPGNSNYVTCAAATVCFAYVFFIYIVDWKLVCILVDTQIQGQSQITFLRNLKLNAVFSLAWGGSFIGRTELLLRGILMGWRYEQTETSAIPAETIRKLCT